MAYIFNEHTLMFEGTNTERLAANVSKFPNPSKFLEIDTKNIYQSNGIQWYLIGTGIVGISGTVDSTVFAVQLNDIAKQWDTWTPTLTWTTATPTGITTIAKYKQIGKTVFFNIKITTTDGAGATNLNITLPIVPKTLNMQSVFPIAVWISGSGTTAKFANVRDNGTNNDISTWYLGTLTSAVASTVYIQGSYEVA